MVRAAATFPRMNVARLTRVRDFLFLSLVVAAHVVAARLLMPLSMFSKYPDAARLASMGQLTAERAGDFSPLYLLIHLSLSPLTILWVQRALGAATIALTYFIAREVS